METQNAGGVDALWAMHLKGPDDLHAAPSREEAERMAEWINARFDDAEIKPHAVAVAWPYTPESHAESLGDWFVNWRISLSGAAFDVVAEIKKRKLVQVGALPPDGWQLVAMKPAAVSPDAATVDDASGLKKFPPLPTQEDLRAAIDRALADSVAAIKVLSTILRKKELQGFAVADEILGNILNVQRALQAARVPDGEPTDAMVEAYCNAVAEYLGALTSKDWEIERFDPIKSTANVARIGLRAALAVGGKL